MANIHLTPQGRVSIVDPAVNLSSIQMRALFLCLSEGNISYYDIVQKIREEPELRLIPEPAISKDVANLAVRGLVVVDKEN